MPAVEARPTRHLPAELDDGRLRDRLGQPQDVLLTRAARQLTAFIHADVYLGAGWGSGGEACGLPTALR
jgi:hypothetical protein